MPNTVKPAAPLGKSEDEVTPMPLARSTAPQNPWSVPPPIPLLADVHRHTLSQVLVAPAPPLDDEHAPDDIWTNQLAPLRPESAAEEVEAWVAVEMARLPWFTVDELEAKIVLERGPYIPLLDFLDEPAARRVEKIEVRPAEPAARQKPSPRPRKPRAKTEPGAA